MTSVKVLSVITNDNRRVIVSNGHISVQRLTPSAGRTGRCSLDVFNLFKVEEVLTVFKIEESVISSILQSLN